MTARLAQLGPAVLRIVVPLAIVAAWWVLSSDSTNPYYPPLERILERFHELWVFASAGSDVVPTLTILGLGFAIAVVLGILNGLQLARMPVLRAMAMPVLTFYRALPGVALIPVFVQLFGFGDGVRVAIVALAALPPVLIATVDGVLGVDPTLRSVGAVYGVPTWRRVVAIDVPAASPRIFVGVQVSLQFAFIAVIASEMVGGTRGIGYLTLLAQQTFVSADMWAGVLLLGLIGIVVNGLMLLLRRWLLGWYDGAQAVTRAA